MIAEGNLMLLLFTTRGTGEAGKTEESEGGVVVIVIAD
jgi:hypothetical protein